MLILLKTRTEKAIAQFSDADEAIGKLEQHHQNAQLLKYQQAQVEEQLEVDLKKHRNLKRPTAAAEEAEQIEQQVDQAAERAGTNIGETKRPRKKRNSCKAGDPDTVIKNCVSKNVKVEELKNCFKCCAVNAGIRCKDRANQLQPARKGKPIASAQEMYEAYVAVGLYAHENNGQFDKTYRDFFICGRCGKSRQNVPSFVSLAPGYREFCETLKTRKDYYRADIALYLDEAANLGKKKTKKHSIYFKHF